MPNLNPFRDKLKRCVAKFFKTLALCRIFRQIRVTRTNKFKPFLNHHLWFETNTSLVRAFELSCLLLDACLVSKAPWLCDSGSNHGHPEQELSRASSLKSFYLDRQSVWSFPTRDDLKKKSSEVCTVIHFEAPACLGDLKTQPKS